MKKIMKLVIRTLAVGFVMLAGATVTISADEFKQVSVPTINQASEYATVDALDIRKVTVEKSKPVEYYIKFTLKEDSWMKFSGSYSLYNHDGIGTHVNIYSNSSLSVKKENMVGDIGNIRENMWIFLIKVPIILR